MQGERETKPWEGHLYLSHTSEATCKLLYKKFFRKTDCTVLHGPWKQILLEQQRTYSGDNKTNIIPSNGIRVSVPPIPEITVGELATQVQTSVNNSPSSSPLARRRVQKPNSTLQVRSGFKISSSRNGIVSPSQLEPFQCFVLFYTSSWVVPQLKNRRLTKIFGPGLVPKIEAYIRDEYNGEQCPGTSFLLETGSLPCKYIVCTSVARNINQLGPDYAYNAFRSSLLAIYNFNKLHASDQITSILCPAIESITTSSYNLVHQMATCYEYWDWHVYAKGAVLPFTHEDEENINKQIKASSRDLVRIAQDLEQYIRVGLLASRGLVYDCELQIILDWLTIKQEKEKGKEKAKHKENGKDKSKNQIKTDIPQHIIAQSLVDVLKRPDIPPFTLTPSEICAGITGLALDKILVLAKEGNVKVYNEIKPIELVFGQILSEGTSGKVYKAKWGSREVAVKVFKEIEPELIMQELTLISLVKHPKLLEPIGGFFDQKTAYIVSELMDMNLLQFLQNHNVHLQFNAMMRIAIDIAEAMEFLHSRGVIHRDLKSVNILIDQSARVAKVCDFGLSRVMDYTDTLTKHVGTTLWMAPEILQTKPYTEKCDVYSFGMVLCELITHALPFKGTPSFQVPEMVKNGVRPQIPQEIIAVTPKDYLGLMKKCWHANPFKRPSFSEIKTTLQSLIPQDINRSLDKNKLLDDDDDEYVGFYPDSYDDESSEGSDETTSGDVREQEEAAMEELKPWLKTIRHQLASEDLLLKCIRARNCKPTGAKHLLLRYMEWYQLLAAGKPIKISQVRKTLESEVLYYVEGACDKEGRHIILWDVSKYNVDAIPERALMQAFVYCLERATETQEAQTKGIVLLANLTNNSMARFSMRIVHSFFGTVQKYFPVIVHRILFLNAPGGFFKVLTMYQSFINATMDVIELVTPAKLQDFVTTENLVPAVEGTYHFDMDLWIRSQHALEGVEYQK